MFAKMCCILLIILSHSNFHEKILQIDLPCSVGHGYCERFYRHKGDSDCQQ